MNDDLARQLAGWYELAGDLRHVISATRLLETYRRESKSDPTLRRSLWVSAHIAYARCFVDGPTVKLDPLMFEGLAGGRAQAHRFLLHTANKHLSQPSNPFLRVGVSVDHDPGGRPIGIAYKPVGSDGPPEDLTHLAWLAAEALKQVEKIEGELIARLKTTLLAQ